MIFIERLFYILITSLLFLLMGCDSKLKSSGEENFGESSLYLQSDSDVKIFSYLNGSPELITQITPDGEIVAIPRNILIPKLNFGIPENPLIYFNRSNPEVASPVDLFVKVFSPSSSAPDKYFEAPVLGTPIKPTNVTSALSWILRWSFSNQKVSITKNQFDSLVAKVEVQCSNCRQKSISEVVQLILSNSQISSQIIENVATSNKTLLISNLTYTPPSLDYAWSFPTLSKDWKIFSSLQEPAQDTISSFLNPTQLAVDLILIQPLNSTIPVKPSSWGHTANLDEVKYISSQLVVNLEDISNTPLLFRFDKTSSGIHTFTSKYTGNISLPIQVIASVLDINRVPNCITSGVLQVRANKLLSTNLDRTLKTRVVDNAGNTINRLQTSKVIIDQIQNLPLNNNEKFYSIQFSTNADSTMSFTVQSDLGLVLPASKFESGRLIQLPGYSLFITGQPINGDQVLFSTSNSALNTVANFVDGVGCADLDPSIENSLFYTKVSGPNGLVVSSTGNISWIPKFTDFNSSNPLLMIPFVVGVTDQSGLTQNISLNIQVLEDRSPQLCVTLRVPGGFDCPSTPIGLLPVSPVLGYDEFKIVNQTLYVTDADNDPIVISVRAINTPSSLGLVADAKTNFSKFSSVSRQSSGTAFREEFLWEFMPHILQVKDVATGILKVEFVISYDVASDPTLSSDIISIYPVDITINNVIDAPNKSLSSSAMCGTLSCTDPSAISSSYTPSYRVLNPNYAVTNLFNPRTNSDILINGVAVANTLKEGEIASIQIPLIATSKNPMALNEPILYSISGQSNSCPFLKSGRVKFEKAICQGSSSLTPDCLNLHLNYNHKTQLQEPIPDFMPQACSFSLSARDNLLPTALTELGVYTLYIQDVNKFPQITLSPALTPENVASIYPTEGVEFNFLPFLQKNFSDLDLGPYNGQDPDLIADPKKLADGSVSPITVVEFNTNAWTPEFKVTIPALAGGTSFSFQNSTDGTTWSNIPSDGSIKKEVGGVIFELTSNSFNGTISFQQNIAPTTTNTWQSVSVKNLDTNANITSTTTGGRFYLGVNGTRTYRLQITNYTSGSMYGVAISNNMIENTQSGMNTTLLTINPIATPVSLNFITEIESASTSLSSGTYTLQVDPARPYFRALYSTPSNLTTGSLLPTISISHNHTLDSRETFNVQCWIVNNPGVGETFTNCSNITDTDGNYFFPTSFRSPNPRLRLTSTEPVPWTPPFSAGIDGNTLGNTLSPSYTVLLRLIDKGFYPNYSILPTAPCQTGPNSYSCVDYRFPITVIENAATPSVQILDSVGNPVNNALWRPQDTRLRPANPTFEVNESSTKSFSVQVSPYSTNNIDQVKFGFRQIECRSNGEVCPRRANGSFMLIEPSVLGGDFSVSSTPLRFSFTASPNYTEGNGPNDADFRTYSYRYKIGEIDSSDNFIEAKATIVGFDIKVKNINHAPTTIIFPTELFLDNGYYMCQSGDVVCSLISSSSLKTIINRSTNPSKKLFSIPLILNDTDILPNGSPSDRLTISIDKSTGFNSSKITIVTVNENGVPVSYLRTDLSSSACSNGNTSSIIAVPLIGSDGRSGSAVVKSTATIVVEKTSGTTCLN